MSTTQNRIWSEFQKAIFDFIKNGIGNALIKAVAGSGKTTTIVEAIQYATGSVIFLAFNKSISEELKKRGVNASTFHSLCFSPVMRARRAKNVEKNKLRILVEDNMGDIDVKLYGQFVTKLVSLGKQMGIGCLIDDTTQNWMDIVEHHDLQLESEDAQMERALVLASKLLQASNESGMIDFDDMLYLAVRDGIVLPKYDNVFVDEAQDTNAIQRAILRKITHEKSRIIAVGDPCQAIYGFRGADSDSMDLIASEFNCTSLPLTVSYRCPKAVVKHAQHWVKDIQSAPNAPEGKVTNLLTKWDNTVFAANDLVVSRTTAPMIGLAYSLLKAHIPVFVMGKEIGDGLKSLIKRMNAKGVNALIEKLNAFKTRESEKFIAKRQEDRAAAIGDKVDCIMALITGMKETNRTIPALLEVIDNLFANKSNAVVMATIHKAKGLESKRVFWLNSHKVIKWAKQDWQVMQENNLRYVATTRAMEELILIQNED